LAGVAILIAIAECGQFIVLGPLVAEIAPPHLLGRYMSLYQLSFLVGVALGQAVGGVLLGTSPDTIWWGGALALALTGAGFLRLGNRIPDPPLADKVPAAAGHFRGDLMRRGAAGAGDPSDAMRAKVSRERSSCCVPRAKRVGLSVPSYGDPETCRCGVGARIGSGAADLGATDAEPRAGAWPAGDRNRAINTIAGSHDKSHPGSLCAAGCNDFSRLRTD
jgi:hypothetical protein